MAKMEIGSVGYGKVNIGSSDVPSAYATTFGNMDDGTVYHMVDSQLKSIPGFDLRGHFSQQWNSAVAEKKALLTTAGGVGTAGYALVPVYVDPRITDQSRKYTPLTELLPRVTNRGMTADYNFLQTKGSAVTAVEDAALSDVTDTEDRGSVAIKFLYSVGRVTGPMQAAMPAYTVGGFQPSGSAAQVSPFADAGAPNAMQYEVLKRARALKELEENLLLNGDAGTDATQFSGIIILLGSTNRSNTASGAGGDLALGDIDIAVQNAFDDGGRPDLAVCNSRTFTDLIGLLNAKIGYLQASSVSEWGFGQIMLNTMVGVIRVIPSMYLSNTADVGRLIFLDTSVIQVRVLQDMTYEELAKTNDSQKFMLKMYEALIITAPAFCSQIYQID